MVVAEPTAGTWLPLAHAVADAGCEIGFVANRDSARLRKAIVGASKTDVIDADMLARCQDVLGVVAAPCSATGPDRLAAGDAAPPCRHDRRPPGRVSPLGAGGVGVPGSVASLRRSHARPAAAGPLAPSGALAQARISSIVEVVAAHSRDQRPDRRAERIRDAAGGWAAFWAGRLDLDALAWEVTAMLDDIAAADRRHRQPLPTRSVCGNDTGPTTY